MMCFPLRRLFALSSFGLFQAVPIAFASSDSVVVFSEIQYHPAAAEDAEWVELHNQMAVDIDLSGWRLDGGIGYAFADGTIIPAGGYLVIASDPAAVPGSLGPFEGRLDNNGEALRLFSNSDRLMNEVRYDDEGDWPAAPDGSGATLALVHPDATPTEAGNWSWSRAPGGTPGAENVVAEALPESEVLLNEISGSDEESFAIELLNRSAAGVSLEGFVLATTTDETNRESALPPHDLEPGGFAVFTAEALGIPVATGERLFLYTPGKDRVLDAVVIEDRPRGRFPDGDAAWFFVDAATLGLPNGVMLTESIVINEILYHHHPQYEREGAFGNTEETPVSAPWRYNDQESLEPGWASQAHPDWPSAGGLFGSSPNAGSLPENFLTPLALGRLTHYFERDFEVAGDPAGVTVQIRHVVDDGAVFYVNGNEIFRFNLPEGVVDASTNASNSVDNAAYSNWITVPPEVLQEGANRLSVELHQTNVLSNDAVFGVALRSPDVIEPAVPFAEIEEEWIELFNRGETAVDLSDWRLEDDVDYVFPEGSTLEPGAYLLVARDAEALRERHPDLDVLGDWSGRLSNKSGRIRLLDAAGNPADTVRYYDDGRWPEAADGGGASLELVDPRADNASPESWAASDTLTHTQWNDYVYRGEARSSAVGPDNQWNDFVMGLLGSGEILIDDVRVIEEPDGAARNLLSNSQFTTSIFGGGALRSWRLLGTHQWGEAVPDPDDPENTVLRLVADGETEHMHNHIETTLTDGIANGTEYEIRFRARFVSGCPRLHTRLYFNRLAQDTVIALPTGIGTPGAPNSRQVENAGPSFEDLRHEPAVPDAGEEVLVSLRAFDPDGVDTPILHWAVGGGAFATEEMTQNADGRWEGAIPGQSAGDVVQFYVEAADPSGATASFPAAGPESRALYQVDDGRATTNGLHNFRIILTPEDEAWLHETINLMSNGRVPCTVIYREEEIFYNVGVRLKGSERGRVTNQRIGFNVKFPSHQLFRGIHSTVAIDRSEGVGTGQREFLINQVAVGAGGIPAEINDLIHVIPPRAAHTGSAELQLARYGSIFLDSQFDDGSEGLLYEYELIYYPTTDDADGYKRPQPDNVVGATFRDYGDDEESYRWNFLLKNNLERDDFSRMMEYVKMWSLNGPAFSQRLEELVDVDAWLRGMAFATLSGAGDQYAANSGHNGMFYITPAGKVIFFPHDVDFAYDANRSITENTELRRIIENPGHERTYLAHLDDILTSSHNRAYLERWAAHYGSLLPGQNFDSHLEFMVQRTNSVRGQVDRLAPDVAFAITSNGGEDFSVETPTVTLEGRGWINIGSVRHVETGLELEPEWLDLETWRLNLPLQAGENVITLQALDHQGTVGSLFAPVGRDSITVTNSGGLEPATSANLVISEIMFDPAPTTAEEKASGFVDANDFEYVELLNIGTVAVDLSGLAFTDGVDFALAGHIEPGERLLAVRNLEAFRLRYGMAPAVLGAWGEDRLSNEGERIELARGSGEIIRSFRYDVGDPWPTGASGTGAALELIGPEANPDPAEAGNWRAAGGTPGTGGDGGSGDEAYLAWMEAAFTAAEQADPAISGPEADPDGDTLNNFGEFVMVQEPKAAGSRALLKVVAIDAQSVSMRYIRRKNTGGRFLIEQATVSAADWTPVTVSIDGVESIGTDTEAVTLSVPRVAEWSLFRLRAQVD